MAISLIAAFKAIPWSDVLTAAPVIVQGAEKLWGSVARKGAATVEVGDAVPPREETLALVELRVQQLEARVADLQGEALASSELIKSLAEQNSQLVRAVDVLRVRTRALTVCCALLAAAAGAVWWLAR